MKKLICVVLLICGTAAANDRVVVNSIVAVPVAVPVTPVAAYSPAYYQAQNNLKTVYVPPPQSPYDKLVDDLAERVAARLGGQAGQFRAAAAPKTMFAQKCSVCHAQGNPGLGKPQLALEAMNCEQRIAAIDAIVSDRMPKGGKLTPQEAAQLIKELSGKSKTAGVPLQPADKGASDVPPPPPNPELGESQ